jgi:hypothetical protein
MSAIPSAAMPHAFADEDVDLRDPHGGRVEEETTTRSMPKGLLVGGGALLAYLLYRLVR